MLLLKTEFLRKIYQEHKFGFALAMFLMFIIGLLPCFIAKILGSFVSILNDESDMRFEVWFALMMLWLVGENFLWRLYDYVFLRLMSEVTVKSIYRYFNIIQRYNNLFFKKYSVGKINYNIMDIARAIDQIFSHFNERILQEVSTIVCSIGMVFYYNVHLGCVITFLGISISLSAYIFSFYIKDLSFKFYAQRSYLSAMITDILLNILHVKNLFQFKRERKNVEDMAGVLAQKDRDMQVMMMYSHITQSALTIITLAYSFYYMYQLKLQGIVGVGVIITVFYLLYEIISSVWEITESLADLFEEWGALNQVLKFVDEKYVCNLDKINTREFRNGDIVLNKIGFGYDGQNNVFDSFSLNVKKGSKVGIVGVSGVGKSTLSSLLNRSYDVLSGDISIGDQSIKDMDLQSLRSNIGIISQQLMLFNRSIKDNISYGSNMENVSEREIIATAKNAGIHDFIDALPNKYDTICTNDVFSGGQKQRILIARLLFLQCPILICDEHTSGLDNFTNQALKATFDKVVKDKTVIFITHNLSLLKDVDRIVVIENGKIIQDGVHDDLLKQDGVYRKLWLLK